MCNISSILCESGINLDMKSWCKNPWQSEYSERYGLATFVNGKYPTTGRQAVFYICQGMPIMFM